MLLPTFFFLAFFIAADGCATTPGSGPPTDSKSFTYKANPPLEWTAQESAGRKKRNANQSTTPTTPTTSSKIPQDLKPSTTLTPSQDDPSAKQQTSVEKAEKRLKMDVKEAIDTAIQAIEGNMNIKPEITFNLNPADLQFHPDPKDVHDGVYMGKTVDVGVKIKVSMAVPESTWKIVADRTFVELTQNFGAVIKSYTMS
ncbi:hypothetical protein L596_024319 [Steinernema carpocapsae]|uniref:Uncharacterized protein n=1 Tax=Steinernema carpocapsae TaxID=34508 RepID=A0A4U5MH44_STECR|nr:hypothetical protein L596_024319 [Steinernema carpocapsae]